MQSESLGPLDQIHKKLRLLEASLGDNPVRIGDIIFNSLDEVKTFVEMKASGLSFSIFHDAVTLLESLMDVYIECKEIILEWFQSSCVGLSEVEAKHVAPL